MCWRRTGGRAILVVCAESSYAANTMTPFFSSFSFQFSISSLDYMVHLSTSTVIVFVPAAYVQHRIDSIQSQSFCSAVSKKFFKRCCLHREASRGLLMT